MIDNQVYSIAQASLSREWFYRFLLRQAYIDINTRPKLVLGKSDYEYQL